MAVQYKVTITQIKTIRRKKDQSAAPPVVELVMYQQIIEQKQVAAVVAAVNATQVRETDVFPPDEKKA